eukprot:COSAG02_NODE_4728_length_5045_cov_9.058835_8_plen_94_part_00
MIHTAVVSRFTALMHEGNRLWHTGTYSMRGCGAAAARLRLSWYVALRARAWPHAQRADARARARRGSGGGGGGAGGRAARVWGGVAFESSCSR